MVRKTNKKTAKHSTKIITEKHRFSTCLSITGKILGIIGCIILVVELFLVVKGTIHKEKRDMPTVVKADILHKVVINPDRKVRLPVCGTERPSGTCLYYVLNGSVYDHVAEDFFEEVAQKTQRSVFTIRLNNPLYAKRAVPPGHFVEIIVPALK